MHGIIKGGIETFKRATGMRAWEMGVVAEPKSVLGRIASASAEVLFPTTSAFVRESERVHRDRIYGPGEGEGALDGIAISALLDSSTLLGATLLIVTGQPELAVGGKLLLNSLLTHWPNSLNSLDRVRRR